MVVKMVLEPLIEPHFHPDSHILGYTLRPRRTKNRWGKPFVSFLPTVSNKAESFH